MSPCDFRDMGNIVDLGPRNPCNSITCEDIAQVFSIERRFVLSYIYIPFAVPEPFVGKRLLRKITLEIEGFRIVKPRDKDRSISPKSFLHSQISDVENGCYHWIPLKCTIIDTSQVARHRFN